VKLNTRNLSLAGLGVFALFAVSTSAQNQAMQLPTKAHPPKAVDAGAADNTQERLKHDAASPSATDTCSYTFTTGSGTTYMKYCVTVNGNLGGFQSPAGVEMLDQDGAFEGYGICDENTATEYYDYAYGDSGNWGAPVLLANTATEVKIERTTSDGLWTLTQTISKVAGTTPYAKVVMTLKNNSAESKDAILLRYANALPDDAASADNYNENYDGTFNSAWGYIPMSTNYATPSGPYGLMLQNVGNSAPVSPLVSREGFAITGETGPPPCNAGTNFAGTLVDVEGSIVYWYFFALSKEQAVTVTDRYMSF
jgi:hypothetical protein